MSNRKRRAIHERSKKLDRIGAREALGASLCCLAPLVLATLGLGGAWVSTLTRVEPLRPLLVVVALASVLVLLAVASTAHAEERLAILSVPGMTCSLCPLTISKALQKTGGVKDVSVDLDTKTVRVRFDDQMISVAGISKATSDAGYPSLPIEEKK